MSSNWPLVQLGELISIKHGFAFKGEFFSDTSTDTVLVTPGNFAIGGGFKADKLKFYNGPIPAEYKLEADDLIVTMTDLSKQADTLGYSALVPEHSGRLYLHNQRIGLVEIKSQELDKLYLYFLMRSHEYRHHVVSSATGSTVKHTSPSKITSFEFHLPPLEIQENIGRSLKHLEDKTAINHQINQTLEQMAQAIFKSWFVDFEPVKAKIATLEAGGSEEDALLAAMQAISGKDEAELTRFRAEQPEQYAELRATAELFPSAMQDSELGEIPEGWDTGQLGSYLDILETGARPKGGVSGITEGLPSVGAENIVGVGNYHYGKEKFVTVDFFNKLKRGIVEHLDCLLYKDGGKPGDFKPRVSMFGCGFPYDKLAINEHVFRLRSQRLGQPYLYFLIGHERVLADLRHKGAKAAIPGINQTDVKTVWTVCPPREVLDIFNTIAEKSLTSILTRSKESLRLSKLRDTLLPKLLSGELSVSDNGNQPSTEPLSPLQEIE